MDNISKIIFQEVVKSFKSKKYNQVLALVGKLLERKNDNAVIHYLKAFSLYQLGETSEAVPLLGKIVEQDKKTEITMKSAILLGYLYIKKQDFENAKKYLALAVEKDYPSPSPYSMLGYIAHEQEEFALADKFFKKTLTFEPENPTFNNNLGYNYLIWKQDVRLAGRYIHKAFNQDKGNINYIHSVGWLYFLSKNVKEAKQMLRKALSLEDNYLIKKHYQMAKRASSITK